MLDINTLIDELPEMLSGNELKNAMQVLPEYDESIRQESDAKRLMKLSDLYNIYLPSQMSQEIYSKLYLGILRSLQKKGTRTAIKQFNQNYKDMKESCRTRATQQYSGIIGGSDSFTIIGTSGIGKSSAISRAIHLITQNRIIQIEEPYTNILPCVCVQCPYDSSVKGLLLEILRMAITVGLAVYLARKYKYTDPREREPLFPFKKLVTLSNPVQATVFFSAFMISLARIISRIRYDIFYGAPQSFAEAMVMIGYYLLDIAIGFIGYFAIVFIILTLEKHGREEKK